jgi:hypothetical protein
MRHMKFQWKRAAKIYRSFMQGLPIEILSLIYSCHNRDIEQVIRDQRKRERERPQ